MKTEVMNQFKQLGIEVNVDEQMGQYEGDGDQITTHQFGEYDVRYVAVGE
jgi:hypothetical protein